MKMVNVRDQLILNIAQAIVIFLRYIGGEEPTVLKLLKSIENLQKESHDGSTEDNGSK